MCERSFAKDRVAWLRAQHATLRAAALEAEASGEDCELLEKLQGRCARAERDLQPAQEALESI
jgi:hypothetical protein